MTILIDTFILLDILWSMCCFTKMFFYLPLFAHQFDFLIKLILTSSPDSFSLVYMYWHLDPSNKGIIANETIGLILA